MEYTIVTTAYNDSENITNFLNNIIQQTFSPKEIIVADGGSKDNTVQVIKDFAEKSLIPVRVLSGKRLNIAQGFNEAIKAASTTYVAVVGIGNTFANDCFALLRDAIEKNKCDYAYPPLRGADAHGFTRVYNQTCLSGDTGKIYRFSLNHGVLIRKEVFEKVGYFYEKFYYAGEDSEFYERAEKMGVTGVCVQDAELRWETPKSLKDFLRQLRVYTIGGMQIYSNKQLFHMYSQRIRRLLIVLVDLASLLIWPRCLLPWCGLILILLYNIAKKILRRRGRSYWLCMVSDYLPMYYILRNRKFLKKENKVNRGDAIL